MSVKPVSPLNLDRYELKYLIPYSLVEPISQYVSLYCEMDYYSQISHDSFYTINSLYLDTPSFLFYRNKELGEQDFSLRIRSYGDQPKAPFFFECKMKNREFSKKRRGKVPIANFGDIFDRPELVKDFDPYQDKNLTFFINLANSYNARPVILSQYRRRAFLSTCDDYARVTFDRSMRYMREDTFNVMPDEARMTNYDHPDSFEAPGRNVVLELKCEQKIPVWMIDLVRTFGLVRDSFSKFQGSMLECYGPSSHDFAYDRIRHLDLQGLKRFG